MSIVFQSIINQREKVVRLKIPSTYEIFLSLFCSPSSPGLYIHYHYSDYMPGSYEIMSVTITTKHVEAFLVSGLSFSFPFTFSILFHFLLVLIHVNVWCLFHTWRLKRTCTCAFI